MNSADETKINASHSLEPDDTTDDRNVDKNVQIAENSDEIDQSSNNEGSSSKKRNRESDDDCDSSVSCSKSRKIDTNSLSHTHESINNKHITDNSIHESTTGSTNDYEKHQAESSNESKKFRHYDAETNSNSSDTPSDLCSTKLNRSETKSNDDKIIDNTVIVADHYNSIGEKGMSHRNKSRIFYMRNFNNWIKTILINEYLSKIRESMSHGSSLRVLDMCCGKGGDLFKWKKANISHLICADIAEVSVKQCENRYKDIFNQRGGNDRGYTPKLTAEFITADCSKIRLREKYSDPSIQLDLVSCQFALHYSFESLQQAMCMLRNASECLKPGGYFIATLPDAYDLVYQWRKTDGNKFGNNIYNVEFCCDKDDIPLFGAKYNFHLEGVVDCPEFLVYLPLLKKLALNLGLEFVYYEKFNEFYKQSQEGGKTLLSKMQALEAYPAYHGTPLIGQNPEDYQDAYRHMQNLPEHRKIGTLSWPEWEAISLYGVIAFKKMKTLWNAEGKPEYSKV